MIAPWLHTHAGLAFDLVDPRVDQVSLRDVAHALSNLCRYTGHASRFYSVAEHSVHVSRRVAAEVGHLGLPRRAVWCALMHDAHEAYLGDVASPIKAAMRAMGGTSWKSLERGVERCVRERFDCEMELGEQVEYAVRVADVRMLATEAPQVLPWPPPRDWELPDWATPYDAQLSFHEPRVARARFLHEVTLVAPADFAAEAQALLDGGLTW
jgi:hypothetical protein